MKKIALIHKGSAYAPEIVVYKHILESAGYYVQVFKEALEIELESFDVEWHFMGMDLSKRKKGRLKIHEYVSLSIPPFSQYKDNLKKLCNSKPDLRIFGSKFIESELGFNDRIPVCYRDAGVSPSFFHKRENNNPEFDFVYTGSTDKGRKTDYLFTYIVKNMPDKRLLVIGTPPAGLSKEIRNHSTITFTGRILYEDVPIWLNKARFGINYIPSVYPYSNQSPYKLLEYCAIGLFVITTETTWISTFEKLNKAKFFKLKKDLSNLKINTLESFQFITPNVKDYTWDKVINQSGILSFLARNL